MTRTRTGEGFDPYAIMRALQDARVDYVLIGGLARVVQGSDEVSVGVDLTPSRRRANLQRLEIALNEIDARRPRAVSIAGALTDAPTSPLTLETLAGYTTIILEPAGTGGYEDLRRKAGRAALGRGLRPLVAAPGDLVRMMEALGRVDQVDVARAMRRVVELDHGLGLHY